MTGFRIWRSGFFFALVAGIGSAQTPSAPATAVSLTPAIVESGSPELIRVDAPAGATLDGEWLGRKLEFFRGRDGLAWFALAGVDVEAPEGASTLRISVRTTAATGAIDLSRSVEIHPAHYRTSTLTVAPQFVAPGPEELKRIKAESRAEGEGVCGERAGAAVVRRFSRAGDGCADRQLRHAARLQRHAGQRSQGDGFSRADGHAGARRQQRRGGAGAAALLRGQLRGHRPRAGAVHDLHAPEPHRRA